MSVNLSFLLQTYFIFKLKIKNLTLYTKKQTGLILYKKNEVPPAPLYIFILKNIKTNKKKIKLRVCLFRP